MSCISRTFHMKMFDVTMCRTYSHLITLREQFSRFYARHDPFCEDKYIMYLELILMSKLFINYICILVIINATFKLMQSFLYIFV